jgi:hypothetical protein
MESSNVTGVLFVYATGDRDNAGHNLRPKGAGRGSDLQKDLYPVLSIIPIVESVFGACGSLVS